MYKALAGSRAKGKERPPKRLGGPHHISYPLKLVMENLKKRARKAQRIKKEVHPREIR